MVCDQSEPTQGPIYVIKRFKLARKKNRGEDGPETYVDIFSCFT